MARERYLAPQVESDLSRKMVLLAGPRQVGKTTLALSLTGAKRGYLNWDVSKDRDRILREQLPDSKLWVFDEIHKHRTWRSWLKGVWDGRPEGQRVLVTGSARLDLYRRGGDSLQGRHHLLRLHPLSAAELGLESPAQLTELLTLGGFPEPFFGGSQREARRWSREYRSLLVREDVVGLERVQDLGNLERLTQRLPDLVGSPLSVNGLREDLQVAHKTMSHWLDVLERLFAIFRVSPFGLRGTRVLRKAQKHYHLDWTLPPEPPQQFENLVAAHLLKWVHFQQDTEGRDVELCYYRDLEGREVDFVVREKKRALYLVECKWGDAEIDRGLRFLRAKHPEAEAWQIHAAGKKDYKSAEGIRVAPAIKLLRTLV